MKAKKSRTQSAENSIPFPARLGMVSELRRINASVNELEQKIKSRAADSSIALSIPLLFIDEIGRCQNLGMRRPLT